MKQWIWSFLMVVLPLRHLYLTSSFGYRVHPLTGKNTMHCGIDLRADLDTVYAVINSRVAEVGHESVLGIFIRITNGPFCFTYGHLAMPFVCKGDTVAAAMPLGISGATGRVTGPHLHFAVQFQHRYIDPLAFLLAAVKIISNP
ncbi:MAG: M23 family metallopeptidase [Bacteroidetes bacterium]|nr:M23 family metallopeptidase [Bacteroidota bacterium]